MWVLWFILYAMIAAAAFSFCYIGHNRINQNKRFYADSDSVLFSIWMAIFWPFTIWFFGPYLFINLYKRGENK